LYHSIQIALFFLYAFAFSYDFSQKIEIDTGAVFLTPTPMIETIQEALEDHKDLEKRIKKKRGGYKNRFPYLPRYYQEKRSFNDAEISGYDRDTINYENLMAFIYRYSTQIIK
jgi:hypothetical protein